MHLVEGNDCSETSEESTYCLKSGTGKKYFVELQIRGSESKVTKVQFQIDTEATLTCNTFINRLGEAVATCEYGALQSEMVGGRIAFGIRDTAIRAKLLGDSELTLKKAITTS